MPQVPAHLLAKGAEPLQYRAGIVVDVALGPVVQHTTCACSGGKVQEMCCSVEAAASYCQLASQLSLSQGCKSLLPGHATDSRIYLACHRVR